MCIASLLLKYVSDTLDFGQAIQIVDPVSGLRHSQNTHRYFFRILLLLSHFITDIFTFMTHADIALVFLRSVLRQTRH